MERAIRLDGGFRAINKQLPGRAFVCVSDNCCIQDANMSGIGTAASSRNLSLTEELERLEQSITLTLQGMLIS